MRWRFFVSPAADGPYNMALDEALMRRASQAGSATFRVYSWSTPTLSFGRNQRARDCYDADVAEELGVRFVRRPTGGRALLHHREVTYSATLPLAAADDPRDAYDFINRVLIAGLGRFGVDAGPPAAPRSLRPGLRPCFDLPAEHEIAVDGRKLVGSAQWRHGGALLQHGSILVRDDQPLIARLLKNGSLGTTTAAATLGDVLGWEPSVEQVAEAILESLREATGCPIGTFAVDAALEADMTLLQAAYADDSWTWRR